MNGTPSKSLSLEQEWARHFQSTITGEVVREFDEVIECASPQLADLLIGLLRYTNILTRRHNSWRMSLDLGGGRVVAPDEPTVTSLFCLLNPDSPACVGASEAPDNPLDKEEEKMR